ncbi:transcriptional regulator, TetR family [Amycolatopsis marina]|uniref:Transcriptional regulator, TetR family n=2 Tax=Amycolatopsis marina TaxID=490629 RepID=A0A1I1A1Z9_9PSEU|nr:transcriptional regulator, TetR family [Amycolatopsis marina]
MHVFWERGYEGTSLADLTAAMGINSPSLYAAFGGKEALFRETVRLYGNTHGGKTTRALREQPTARAAVDAMLRSNAETYADPDLPSGCMIVLSATNYTPSNEGVRDFLAEMRKDGIDDLRQRLKQGIADGDLPAHADVEGMAAFYGTVLHGLSIQARDSASIDELIGVIDTAMACWDRFAGAETGAAER